MKKIQSLYRFEVFIFGLKAFLNWPPDGVKLWQ